jgi:hypothetical protein
MSEDAQEEAWRNYALAPQYELRLETEDQQGIVVKLAQGTAEIYGVELAIDREYRIRHRKIAIYTYRGCQLMIQGECSLAYQSSETPMIQYINVHYNLEIMRKVSIDTGNPGPKVCSCDVICFLMMMWFRFWWLGHRIRESLRFAIFLLIMRFDRGINPFLLI